MKSEKLKNTVSARKQAETRETVVYAVDGIKKSKRVTNNELVWLVIQKSKIEKLDIYRRTRLPGNVQQRFFFALKPSKIRESA